VGTLVVIRGYFRMAEPDVHAARLQDVLQLREAARLLSDCVAADLVLPHTLPAFANSGAEAIPPHIAAALRWLAAQAGRDAATALNTATAELMATLPPVPAAEDEAAPEGMEG
jgi:hypothetical protein